jgi:hypothetical protein
MLRVLNGGNGWGRGLAELFGLYEASIIKLFSLGM